MMRLLLSNQKIALGTTSRYVITYVMLPSNNTTDNRRLSLSHSQSLGDGESKMSRQFFGDYNLKLWSKPDLNQ